MDEDKPTKNTDGPDWAMWIFAGILVLLAVYVMSQGASNAGPACDLVRGC